MVFRLYIEWLACTVYTSLFTVIPLFFTLRNKKENINLKSVKFSWIEFLNFKQILFVNHFDGMSAYHFLQNILKINTLKRYSYLGIWIWAQLKNLYQDNIKWCQTPPFVFLHYWLISVRHPIRKPFSILFRWLFDVKSLISPFSSQIYSPKSKNEVICRLPIFHFHLHFKALTFQFGHHIYTLCHTITNKS